MFRSRCIIIEDGSGRVMLDSSFPFLALLLFLSIPDASTMEEMTSPTRRVAINCTGYACWDGWM